VRKPSSAARPLGSPYEGALEFLASRPRSLAEIQRHLHSKHYDDDAIDGAIDKLRAQRYVNDLDFAKYWIEQRSRFRPKGDQALVSELINKGVTRETIDAALGETPQESESDRARRAIVRQLMRWQSLDPAERKRKIHAFLAQRGFGYEVIEEVLTRPESEAEAATD
jgi:regulatory protein